MAQRDPLRVFVTVRVTSDHYQDAWEAPDKIIPHAVAALPLDAGVDTVETSSARVVAISRTDSKTRMVFDLFHDNYDPATGHLKGGDALTVWAIVFGERNKKDTVKAIRATGPMQCQINHVVRRMHAKYPVDALPPFREDYANNNIPMNINPRCPGGLVD